MRDTQISGNTSNRRRRNTGEGAVRGDQSFCNIRTPNEVIAISITTPHPIRNNLILKENHINDVVVVRFTWITFNNPQPSQRDREA